MQYHRSYAFSTRQNTNAKPLTACWGYVYRFRFYGHLIFAGRKSREEVKLGNKLRSVFKQAWEVVTRQRVKYDI